MSDSKILSPHEKLSNDSLFDGELRCLQHLNGYRFSIDSVLLAHFIEIIKGDSILDLGTGSGIISLILLYRWQQRVENICGLEVQESLAALARKNFKINGYESRTSVVLSNVTDIKMEISPETFDKVVCNPPFYPLASGRKSQHKEAMVARHQIAGNIKDFLNASFFACKNGGKVYFIYPADQLAEIIILARELRLELKGMQCIYSYPDEKGKARLILLEFKKNGGQGLEIFKPLYIYKEKNGPYSPEVMDCYRTNKDRTFTINL